MPLEREEETAIGKESISSPSPALRMSALHRRTGSGKGGGGHGVGVQGRGAIHSAGAHVGLNKVLFNANLKFHILWRVLWLAIARGLCSDITSHRSTESICFKKALEESLKYVKDPIHAKA